MLRIDVPSAKLNVVFKAGALPQIDPAHPEFVLMLGTIQIDVAVSAKVARKLATHPGGAVLQGKLVDESGRLKLLEAGFQFIEPKPTEGGGT